MIFFKSLLNLASLAAIFLSSKVLLFWWRISAIVEISRRRFLASALDIVLKDLRGASFKEQGFLPARFMAETRRSAWRTALASSSRSSACPKSLAPSGESKELVLFSVKNCWKRARLERVLSLLSKASADLVLEKDGDGRL